MSVVFVDANIVIYLVEAHPEFGPLALKLLRAIAERGDQLCTSTLAAAEVEAGAKLMGDETLQQRYRTLFNTPGWELLPFTAETIGGFVQARALAGVKAPDAVHLACAAQRGVDVFLTNDAALLRTRMPGISFVVGLSTDIFGPLSE